MQSIFTFIETYFLLTNDSNIFLAYYVIFSHSQAFVAVVGITLTTTANRNLSTNKISKYNFKTRFEISKKQ